MKIYKNIIFNNIKYNVCINNEDPSGDGCIREIFINNEYNLDTFVNLENHIIDIGANCGMATIILAKQNPNAIILSFEPDIATYELLKENVELNNLKNVYTYNLAVSDSSNKTLKLFSHPNYSGGNTTCSNEYAFNDYFKTSFNTHIVNCISFDDIIKIHNITKIDVLKIDCEGAEYDIIYSSLLFKNKIVNNIVGEFHNLSYNINTDKDNIKLLNYCKEYINGINKITMLTL